MRTTTATAATTTTNGIPDYRDGPDGDGVAAPVIRGMPSDVKNGGTRMVTESATMPIPTTTTTASPTPMSGKRAPIHWTR
jgi:hypothetical protein